MPLASERVLTFVERRWDDDDTVVLYGHLDKQPEMTGWREGLGPWIPVLDGDRLYGRGGADDGYAAFASLTAIEALRDAGGEHAEFWAHLPAERAGQIDEIASEIVTQMAFPWAGNTNAGPISSAELVRAKTWEPSIATIADPRQGALALSEVLTVDPPADSDVTVDVRAAEAGWNAPPTAPWLADAVAAVADVLDAHARR